MKRLVEIVKTFPKKRVVVIGDTIADQFVYGEINRVSREAPVFILRHEHTETSPGGAGNCAANLAALGARVTLISVAGDDEAGNTVIEKLRATGVNCERILVSKGRKTTTKVRVLAGQIHSTRQQVIRIDYDGDSRLSDKLRDELHESVRLEVSNADALILSDYNYGVADPSLATSLNGTDIPTMVDSRFRLSSFSGFTSATPNEDEVTQLLHEQPQSPEALATSAEKLRAQLGYRALLVTRGGRGMILAEANSAPLHIDAAGSHQPVDVTGAGDTVIAAYSAAISSGASFADAARIANFAGGLVVMKRGTATVSADELISIISERGES